MSKHIIFVLFAMSFFIGYGCRTKDKTTTCAAGNGGTVTLVVYPKHHGKPVRPYTAYIKFNATDAPASLSGYDITKAADTTEDHIEITGMKCGNYYIYAQAYDTSIRANVKGGLPYTLDPSVKGETNIDIFVTE